MEWSELLNQLEGQTKQKLLALDKLGAHVQSNVVYKEQVSALLDMSGQLLADNNFKVALKLLNCWESIAAANRDVIRPYINALLPHVVERLSDNRQDVRQAACNLLLELLQVLRPDVLMERLGRFWNHKHWKVRHGLLQLVAEAVSTMGEAVLVPPRDEGNWVLNRVIQLVGDPESAVRDAAVECLEEVYKVFGEQLVDFISRHNLRPAHLNSIYARLAQLGADVMPAPTASAGYTDQSPTPSGRKQQQQQHSSFLQQEEFDPASSGAFGDAAMVDQQETQSVHSEVSPTQVYHPARQQLAAEESSTGMLDGGSSRLWGTAAAAKSKRGGYKDGGGITSDGGLPPVQPLYIGSERELRTELERITATLSRGAVDWEKRVAALVRLEGVVKGGAAGTYEAAFLELLRQLRDPLLEQAVDRRSAVARQAAHMMELLAATLGYRFESYAVVFMSALFKALVITVQVVSEAADTAVKGILHHCHAPKLVQSISDVLTGDKNAKLRQHCSAFLLQVLEEWEPLEYQRHLDAIEAALTAAVQDAMGETRMAGRVAFAAYANSLPDRATALLRRLDSGLQQKLHDAVAQYSRGAHMAAVAAPVQPARPTSCKPARTAVTSGGAAGTTESPRDTVMGPPPAKPPRSSRTASTYQRAAVAATLSSGGPAATMASAGLAAAAPAGINRPSSRKSVAGMPMRVPGPATGSISEGGAAGAGLEAAAVAAAAAVGGRRRTSVLPQRVLYQHESPPQAARLHGSGIRGLAGEASKGSSVPNSPESCAHSEVSVGGGSDMRGMAHHGTATRLFQQPKQQHAQQHILQPVAGGGGLSRSASATDDLQLLNTIRDQQQQQLQYQQTQYQLAAQPSSHSVLSMAATIAAAGAGLAGVQQQQQRPATLARAVAGVNSNPKDWKERVEKINALADTLTRQAEAGASSDAYLDLEKALPKLLAAVDDAHFKVSLAALAALTVCLNTAPHVMEAALEKVLPLLFLKLCGAKQQVRSAAEGALQACALQLGADSLLPALNRSLEAMKQPAARVSVMEFCVLFLGEGKVAGVPSTSGNLRQWISRNIPMLLDKNPNVRQMAARALATMYSIDPASVAACMQQSTPQEALAVQRSLAAAEAAAAAEEADDHAAAVAASNAEHVAMWAHKGHWGTGGGAASTSSSMDLSTVSAGGAAGVEAGMGAVAGVHGIRTGMVDMAVSGSGGGYHSSITLPAAAAAAGVTRLPASHLSHQQQQRQQQVGYAYEHRPGDIHSVASSPGATAGGASLRDVLGRPVPASFMQQTPAADAGHLVVTVGPTAVAGGPGLSAASATPAAAPGGLLGSSPSSSLRGAALSSSGGVQASAAPLSPGPDPAVGAAAAAAAAAAATGDASSQARHLTVLVHRLQSRPGEDVLAELAACASTLCKQAWVENFSKVLLAGLSAAQHNHEPIRELAFLLVLALAKHQGELFEPVLDVVLQPLLQGCADESREVLMAAQQALETLLAVMPPLRCVDILAHKLPSDEAVASGTAVDGEVLCATIRSLQLVCRQMTSQQVLSVAPSQLLPGLVAAFNHARPDVRKAVVFCLVDVWIAAGEGLTPYLSSLSTSQLKLLTIYYNRTLAGKQQQH